MNFRRTAPVSVALMASLGLAGCAADVNPVRDMFVAVGAGGKPAPAPEFVAGSRPANLDYVPVGTTKAGPAKPARKPEEAKAVEAELDALRTRQEADAAALRAAAAAAAGPVTPAPPVSPAAKKPARP